MNIFKYDRQGKLVSYVFLDKDEILKYFFTLKNRTFIKFIKENDDQHMNGEDYSEITVFLDDVKLITEYYFGDYWIKAIKDQPVGNFRYSDTKKEFFFALTDTEITNFSVEPTHINTWSQKLKGI